MKKSKKSWISKWAELDAHGNVDPGVSKLINAQRHSSELLFWVLFKIIGALFKIGFQLSGVGAAGASTPAAKSLICSKLQ